MNPQLADLSDLREWGDRNVSRPQLPLLLRRLLLASIGADLLRAPAGDAVGEHGWDIQLDVPAGLPPFVPPGKSRWEGGVSGDPRAKAQSDFKKRTEQTTAGERADLSLVFFTPRHFEDAEAWIDAKKKEKHGWKDILVVDGVILEEWLESQPAVHIWFSELIGKVPTQVGALSTWWERWSAETDPAMPPGAITAGREDRAAQLRAVLRERAQSITIAADTPDEGLAFIAAALQDPAATDPSKAAIAVIAGEALNNDAPVTGPASVTGDSEDADQSDQTDPAGPADIERDAVPTRGALVARAVVVESAPAWTRLMHHTTPLILIPLFDNPDVNAAVSSGHQVVIPATSRRHRDALLPRIRVDQAADAFRQAGVEFSNAYDLAVSARRSLSSLRRRLARSGSLRDPVWAEGSDTSMLGPMLLFGGWHEDFPADIDLIVEVVGTQWKRLSRDLQALAGKPDPPIRVLAKEWQFLDPIDAWDLLAESATSPDLEAFHDVVTDVLTEPDPLLALPVENRMTAQMDGVRRKYSDTLRRGMATTLAVLGAVVGDRPLLDGVTGQDHATRAVREVLAGDGPDHWVNLAPLLPILAEAAPEAFLDAVERALAAPEQPLLAMFGKIPDAFGQGQSVHHQLLWSLERLAYSRQRATRSLLLVAKLAEIDPGDDRSMSRPAASIVSSLHLMHPQSAVTDATRPDFLNLLEARSPRVLFDVMIRLVRGISGGTVFSMSGPHWRDWVLPEGDRTFARVYGAVQDIVVRLITRLATEPERAKELVKILPDPMGPERRALLDAIVDAAERLGDSDRREVAEALAKMASRYQGAPEGAAWSIPSEDVDAIAEAARSLSADVFTVPPVEWFSFWPRRADSMDPEMNVDEFIDENRTSTIRSAYETGGLPAVVELTELSQAKHMVGMYLARHTDVSDDDVFALAPSLDDFDSAATQLVLGYAAERFGASGVEWLTRGLEHSSDQVQAVLFRAINPSRDILRLLDSRSADVQNVYWSHPLRVGIPDESVQEYAERLLARGLAWSALMVLIIANHRNREETPPVEVHVQLTTLEAVRYSEEDPREIFGHHAYGLGELLDHLATSGVDHERLAQIEYFFYPLLEESREPAALYRQIARNPDLFASIVIGSYRRETDDEDSNVRDEAAGADPALGVDQSSDADPTRASADTDTDSEERANAAAASEAEDGTRRPPVFSDADLLDDKVARHLFGRNGWSILYHWTGLPGQKAKHEVDAAALRAWVQAVTENVDAFDRPTTGRQSIGQVLASPVTDPDGTWPHRAVRDLLEELQDIQIQRGMLVARFNQRGVTSRSPHDGGAQEWTLAERYRTQADAVRDSWPRTATLLDDLAKGYESDARREDREVDE